MFIQRLWSDKVSDVITLDVHLFLYARCIKALGTQKHNATLLDAIKLGHQGCFAMTELGHGSNVFALETTATYDPSS